MGDINLTPESYALDEAVVVGQAPMAVTEGDTTVFNASAYRTPEGSMLEELVKQLPGGEIDADGKLKFTDSIRSAAAQQCTIR